MATARPAWRPTLLALHLLLAVLPAPGGASGRPSGITPRPVLPQDATLDMAPLPYVGNSVAGLSVRMDASLVEEYNGEDKDAIVVDIEGQGPTRFSLPRWNQGDYAPRLQPRRPFSQTNLGRVMDLGGSAAESPTDIPAQAWRPSIERGVVIGSVSENGKKWNDSTPFFYGTLACVYDSHGFGYSMDDGKFENHNPNIDIAVGKLGLFLEGNINTAVAWFPYDQGWVGGYVDTPGEYSKEHAHNAWTSSSSFSPSLPRDASRVVSWDGYGALLSIPNVHSSSDGMIFLTSTNPNPGNNDLNSVSTFPENGGWRVQVREDDQPISSIFCLPDQAMFAFLYVPYSSGGLIGGHVDGSTGGARVSRGVFSSVRVSEGVYHIRLLRLPGLGFFDAAQPPSDRDGMLLLQVVGHEPSSPKFSKHAVLSYTFLPNGTVRVEAHRLERPAGGGVLDEKYPPTDSDFYFAWVDFRTPLTPTPDTFTGRDPHIEGNSFGFSFGAGFRAGVLLCLLLLGVALLGLGLAVTLSRRYSLLANAPLPKHGPLAEEGPSMSPPDAEEGSGEMRMGLLGPKHTEQEREQVSAAEGRPMGDKEGGESLLEE